ncbi:hypothetical protein LTR12_017203 [Friedmanniomyces endolithicus]|nr:hypothetical protein LTR87_016167 [Friedmanniomyces endolithicus]KAK1808429.1 hypothetical protein LTR12_017203 [Friedmanniomyces endolithicus]
MAATDCIGYSLNALPTTVTYAITTLNNVLCPSAAPICWTGYITGGLDGSTAYSFYDCGTASTVFSFMATPTTTYGTTTDTVIISAPPTEGTFSVINSLTSTTSTTSTSSSSSTTSTSSSSSTTSTSSSSSTTSTSSSSSTTSTSSGSSASPTPRPIDAGATAGGVVGGVEAVALIAGLIWFVAQRKRRKPQNARIEVSQYGPPPGG